MRLDTAIAVSVFAALIGCGGEQLQKRQLPPLPQGDSAPRPSSTPRQPQDDTPSPTACDRVEELDASCPGAELVCADETVGECILAQQAAVPGWCAIGSGDDLCDGASLSADTEAYCRVQSCYGEDYSQCLDDALAGCAPEPPPPPPGLCNDIDAIAEGCPGYAYECPAFPVEQSQCFLDLLQLMVQEVGNVCFMFDEADARCAGGAPTIEGFTSCAMQECFGVSSYDACMNNLEVVCAFAG